MNIWPELNSADSSSWREKCWLLHNTIKTATHFESQSSSGFTTHPSTYCGNAAKQPNIFITDMTTTQVQISSLEQKVH